MHSKTSPARLQQGSVTNDSYSHHANDNHLSPTPFTEGMSEQGLFSLAADSLLVTHAVFVLFVVLGLLLVLTGRLLCWQWIRNPWFRALHLLAIGVVVLQSWLGVVCPLTNWEMELRRRAGESIYDGSFVAYWLHRLLYYDAPLWVFAVCYSIFLALVLASWILVRPRGFRDRQH